MTNKEIKVGDKIWLYSAYLIEDEYHTVLGVKKSKTLVAVVVSARYYDKEYEITMYGHASSSMLSGFDRKYGNRDTVYTCDYSQIERETKMQKSKEHIMNAGYALLHMVKFLKQFEL